MITQIILITLLSIVASGVGTMSGFGLSTIMTPVILFFVPFQQTILLVCIIHLFHDMWKMLFFRAGIDWRLFIYFGIPSVIASIFGATLITRHTDILSALLGVFLIACVFLLLCVPKVVIQYNWLSGLIGGGLSGFFAGIFGMRGAVRSVFLTAYDLHKATFIGTTGAISLLIDSGRLVTYLFEGIRLDESLHKGLLLFIPASFFGAWIGQRIVHKVPQEHFRKLVGFFLLVVGIKLLIWPFFMRAVS